MCYGRPEKAVSCLPARPSVARGNLRGLESRAVLREPFAVGGRPKLLPCLRAKVFGPERKASQGSLRARPQRVPSRLVGNLLHCYLPVAVDPVQGLLVVPVRANRFFVVLPGEGSAEAFGPQDVVRELARLFVERKLAKAPPPHTTPPPRIPRLGRRVAATISPWAPPPRRLVVALKRTYERRGSVCLATGTLAGQPLFNSLRNSRWRESYVCAFTLYY